MITHQIGKAGNRAVEAIVRAFAASRINPNVLPFIGMAINALAA